MCDGVSNGSLSALIKHELIAALWTNTRLRDFATLDHARNSKATPMIASNLLIRTGHFNSVPPDRRNAPSKIYGELIAPCFLRSPMLNDRREAERHVVNRPAKLLESPSVRECTIRDISGTGVKLVVPGGLASDQFTLFDGEAIEHRCLVIWRPDELIGARFENQRAAI
jgi:hypothetical protein